ncbi:hypothetical protein LguiA_009635 [Lonicera macranthoides]
MEVTKLVESERPLEVDRENKLHCHTNMMQIEINSKALCVGVSCLRLHASKLFYSFLLKKQKMGKHEIEIENNENKPEDRSVTLLLSRADSKQKPEESGNTREENENKPIEESGNTIDRRK